MIAGPRQVVAPPAAAVLTVEKMPAPMIAHPERGELDGRAALER